MKNDYSRNISLLCPTCGASDFSYDEDRPENDRSYECQGCGLSFSHQEMLDGNQELVSRAVEETKQEILSDIHKDFKKMLKKHTR